MRERAVTLGGNFEISSEPGKGTVVYLSFPVQPSGTEQITEIN
jgi:signal transduction histidine kinase